MTDCLWIFKEMKLGTFTWRVSIHREEKIDKLISKMYMEMQRTKNSQNNLEIEGQRIKIVDDILN